jgi:hypothetical protein
MPTQQFNARRLKELKEILDIEYDKYHEFEKDISLSTANEKILLKQRLKREIAPRLSELEKEYAELLVTGVPTGQIPEDAAEGEAKAIVTELSEATSKVLQSAPAESPPEMLRLLEEIKGKLSEPKEAAAAKLKVSLPLIPTICSYEIEVDTVPSVQKVWSKARDFLKGLVKSSEIAAEIEDSIKGGTGVDMQYFENKENIKAVSEKIDRMLRNPRVAFRTTERLARGSPKRGNGVSIVDSSGRGGLAFFAPPRL